jgi:O-antigen/teichoic acid export membrane protein
MSIVPVVRRNSVYSFLAFSFRLIANMALFVGIARFYGQAAFSQFSLAHVYFSIMLLIADFGYDFYLATEIGREARLTVELVRKVLPMKIVFSGFAVSLMLALALIGQSDQSVKMLMVVLALSVPLNSFMTFAAAIFRGNQDVLPEARVAFTQNLLLLVFLVMIALLGLPLMVVACAFVASKAYGFISLWQRARERFPGLGWATHLPETKEAKVILGSGFSFGLHMLFSTLCFQLDTILLAYLSGQNAVGQYQAVMKLAALVLVLNEVAITAVIPVLAQAFERDEIRWMRIGKVVCKSLHLFGGFFGLLFLLSPEEILGIVYGKGKFVESVPVMRIFGVILLIRFGMETYGMMLTTARKQRFRTMVVILATVANALANVLVIPRFGIVGAAWVSLGTNALIAIAYFGLMAMHLRRWLPLFDSGQLLIFAGFIVTGGIFWYSGITTFAMVVPLVFIITAGLTYVGFSRNELALVSSFFRLGASRPEVL